LGAFFADEGGIGGNGLWDSAPEAVVREVAYRTPGFGGWQQEQWWTHCGDAAAFVGRAGYREIRWHGPQLVDALRQQLGMAEGKEWQQFLRSLDADGSPTAYLFRCRHCGRLGGYTDYPAASPWRPAAPSSFVWVRLVS
jgi:uncharacterized protein CbrC (UPF0167 family)